MAGVRRNLVRVTLLTAAVCAAVWLVRVADPRYLVREALAWIQNLGGLAPVFFVLAYVVACLTFFPGVILTLGGGILFGPVLGTVYVCLGATLGACSGFLISRYLARDWVYHRFAGNATFRAIDQAVAKDGWKVVGLIRLSPVFPFIPMNFLFGLTSIPFLHFAGATAVAIVPLCAMFVYLGSLLGDIAALGNEPIATGRAQWIVSGIGLASTVVVTLVVTRIARKALGKVTGEDE